MSTARERARQRSELARLKKLGLYSGNARKNPTKYGLSQLRKYQDVLSGKAAVVKAPSRKQAREFASGKDAKTVRVKGDKVVVPKLRGEQVRWSRKEAAPIGIWKDRGVKKRRRIGTKASDFKRYAGTNTVFALTWARGSDFQRTFYTYEELQRLMSEYQDSRWKTIADYVEIVEDIDDEDDE